MSLPDFTKQGSKLATPGWMSGTAQLIFPRIFDNDAHRGTLSGLPASSYSCLFSTDHSAGTGYIGRADFDDIEGTWTDSGAAIHSGADQRETPHPFFDAANSRVNVYVHDDTTTVTNGDQATRLLTTTDLATLTDQGQATNYGRHTGYAEARFDGTNWLLTSLLIGGIPNVNARWSSTNPASFGSAQYLGSIHGNQSHIAGTGNCFSGVPRTFQWDGDWYWLTTLSARPSTATSATAIVAYPIDATTKRPSGGYYTLLTPGASGADDELLMQYYDMVEIGGTLYLVYVGRKVSDSTQRILLAKWDAGSSSQTAPIWTPNSDGSLSGGNTETLHIDWDAANDALPASLTKTAVSGTDSSSQSAGNYYELKTGSGSTQNLTLTTTSTFDPTAYETLEIEFTGLYFDNSVNTNLGMIISMGWKDDLATTTEGVEFFFRNQTSPSIRQSGAFLTYKNGVSAEVSSYTMPYHDPSTFAWVRSNPFTVAVRLHDFGQRVSLLVDDNVAYHRDVSSEVDWSVLPVGYLQLRSITSTFPQRFARFTNVTVRTLLDTSTHHKHLTLLGAA